MQHILLFLSRISGNQQATLAFDRFMSAANDLEKAGLRVEDAVAAKSAIDSGQAGFSGFSGVDSPKVRRPWER